MGGVSEVRNNHMCVCVPIEPGAELSVASVEHTIALSNSYCKRIKAEINLASKNCSDESYSQKIEQKVLGYRLCKMLHLTAAVNSCNPAYVKEVGEEILSRVRTSHYQALRVEVAEKKLTKQFEIAQKEAEKHMQRSYEVVKERVKLEESNAAIDDCFSYEVQQRYEEVFSINKDLPMD